jgi:hypothetical protein
MNRIEILFRLSDTADNLEAAGLFREAVVLTNVMKRMAESRVAAITDAPDPTLMSDNDVEYAQIINRYKDIVYKWNSAKNQQERKKIINDRNKIYFDYINKLNDQINNSRDANLKSELNKRLQNFKLQTDRILMHSNYQFNANENNKAGNLITNQDIYNEIKYYGLENAKDVNDFNARWKRMTDYFKTTKFNSNPNGPFVFDSPGMQQYLANLYQQLKLKYI